MHQIQASFSVNTPLFMVGSDQQAAELRLPSIKGVLRFWWRALRYAELNGNIGLLRTEEAQLFGSTERQSSVRMSITDVHVERTRKQGDRHEQLANRPGACYLGYGVIRGVGANRGQLIRGCLDGCRFTLSLLSRQPLPDDLVRAIKVMGLLGGLGSKARKGYGSLTMNSLDGTDWSRPADFKQLQITLGELLAETKKYQSLPMISAFSAHTRIDLLHDGTGSLGLLDEYGQRMQRYRSWGQTRTGNMVNGSPSEKRFEKDHHWSKGNAPSLEFHPERVIFGLPHNYFVDGRSIGVEPNEHDRRASPLFYHVHDYGNRTFAGISLILKSQFLPDAEKIKAGGKRVAADVNYDVLTEFLEAKIRETPDQDTTTSYFKDRQVMWPSETGA